MSTVILPGSQTLRGNTSAPPSKSETIREAVASLLSKGTSLIINPLLSDDTEATLKCCQALGAKTAVDPFSWEIQSQGEIRSPRTPVNCLESATTLRFLTAIAALAPGPVVLTGEKSLLNRPVGILAACLRQLGVDCFTEKGDGYPPVIVMGGGIEGGEATLRGDESSQYVSALLFASPRARSAIRVKLSSPLESAPYVELTLRTLRRRGIEVYSSKEMDDYSIHSGQSYQPENVKISGDYSSASFLLVAGVITRSKISVSNLTRDSGQADEKILQVLGEMGVKTHIESDAVSIVKVPQTLSSIDLDIGDSPDLAPVLSVLACFAEGTSILRGARRLKIKESDRLSALESELSKMGAEIKAENDQLLIEGTHSLRGATIDSHGDHRIAMAGVVAGLAADGISQVLGAQTISKSYPNFLQDLINLGAKLDVR